MIIGLTGGIASGKSFVAGLMEEWGLPVVDADKIAREVAEPGEQAYEQIIEAFGSNIVNIDGTINRKSLGKLIFEDDKRREILNQIMHPAIRSKMIEEKEILQDKGHEHIVFDLPLLIENQLHFMVDKVLLVYVEDEIQLARLMERDQSSEEDALNRIRSQMPLIKKREFADKVIDNGGSREDTKKQLKNVLANWKLPIVD
ncbi:dephospho-CoA kinase [Bacillus sp. FJAT-44742]|uniref:dephospho-CoA kinase n=1 Tax=Bacillus sp. FJAT-44742 TaxID=2014005 RepID=UPI001E56F438|nr:dephospho-CoA kinase [Bacillus sp. FJAT-44742]